MKSILWLRDDLRIHDHRPLARLSETASEGILVWCVTPSFLRAGPTRRRFIVDSLLRFKIDAERLGATVLIYNQPARDVLPVLAESFGADSLFCSSLPAFEEAAEERFVASRLGQKFNADPQASLLHPSDLPYSIASLPEVFTQFRHRVEKNLTVRPEAPAPRSLPSAGNWRSPIPIWDPSVETASAQVPSSLLIIPGETAALNRLDSYLWQSDRIQTYKLTRNGLIEWDDSSKLSAYLSVGALSPRRVYFELKRYEETRIKNESTYWLFFELLWRDYFKFIAEKWGARLFSGMKTAAPAWKFSLPPQNQSPDFTAWCHGKTGDRFVDANMRELNATGWMSGRGRQNVASFLAKTRRVDWRLGASYFEEKLIDYDAASNWGNWTYVAGVGQDGRDRAFNTEHQAAVYDADGAYRDRWCPLIPHRR